jgi:hypothetical protein
MDIQRMKQARKSRYRGLAAMRPAIAILAVIALVAPAAAIAQSSAGEYDNVHLPNAGGRVDLPSGPASGSSVQATNASDIGSGGGSGGTTLLLVGLLVVAAGCAGVAVWRLRGDGNDGSPPPTPPVNRDTPGESGSV